LGGETSLLVQHQQVSIEAETEYWAVEHQQALIDTKK
jgi:hypothetical protein